MIVFQRSNAMGAEKWTLEVCNMKKDIEIWEIVVDYVHGEDKIIFKLILPIKNHSLQQRLLIRILINLILLIN